MEQRRRTIHEIAASTMETAKLHGSSTPASAEPQKCGKCGGIGWLHREVDVGDPHFGEPLPCPNCNPQNPARGWEAHFEMTVGQQALRLDAIEVTNRPATKRMVEACGLFVRSPRQTLTIHGACGTGKSMALMAVVNELRLANVEAVYTTVEGALAYVRSAFNVEAASSGGDAPARLKKLCQVPVLALDEFDKLHDTPWSREQMHTLMGRRHDLGIEGIVGTLVAMNADPGSLSEWMASRLMDGRNRIVHCSDSDIRPLIVRPGE